MSLRRTLALVIALVASACASSRNKGGLVSFAAPEAVSVKPGGRYALLVGIDRYDDERFPALRYAARDARRLAEALTGFGTVRVLATPETTNRAMLLQELRDLAKVAARPSDTVVVYVSGHGTLAQRPGGGLERVLVARDTRMDLAHATGLPIDDVLSALEQIPARRKLLVLATCHSGRGKSALSDPLADALARMKGPLALAERSEATIVLTASAFNEAAREDDGFQHDVYTHFLIEALVRGDRDLDGAVTASEAHDWARERTYEFTRGAQRPTSESSVLGVDPIVLAGERVRSALPVIFSYSPSANGLALEIDGRRKGVLPGGVAVDPGEHDVRLLDSESGAEVWSSRLDVQGSAPINLAELVPPPLEHGLEVDGGAAIALSSRTRRQFMPVLGGVGVAYSVRGGARGAWWGRVAVDAAAGHSEAPGVERDVPYWMQSMAGSLWAGRAQAVGEDVTVSLGVGVGWMQLWRQLRLDGYAADQRSGGPTAGARGSVEWRLQTRLRVGASVELMGAWLGIDGTSGPEWIVAPGAFAATGF